jgi:hypothetical protein
MIYTATFLQEVTRTIVANDTLMAGALAKEFARNNKLQLLSVYRKDVTPVAPEPADG